MILPDTDRIRESDYGLVGHYCRIINKIMKCYYCVNL